MYIRIDNAKRVIEVYEQDHDGLIFANWNLEGSLMDDRCVYKYKYIDSNVIGRTQEEMDADWTPRQTQRSEAKRIAALEQAMAAIEEGITGV